MAIIDLASNLEIALLNMQELHTAQPRASSICLLGIAIRIRHRYQPTFRTREDSPFPYHIVSRLILPHFTIRNGPKKSEEVTTEGEG